MKRVLAALFFGLSSITMFAGAANAALVDAPVDANEFISVGGDDWAWAGPCAPFAPSCGEIDLSYQGGQGWALASTAQIESVLALVGGLTAWVDLFSVDDVCASRFFSNVWEHCDYSDAYQGYIFNYSGNSSSFAVWNEVFAIRVSAIPVPASLPLLLGALAGLGFLARRRRSVV